MSSTLPLTGNGDITMNSTPADGTIKLVNAVSTAGFRLSIAGSNAGSANSNGGNILLTPGAPTGTGQKGIVDIAGNITVQGPAWGPGNQGVVALGDSNNYIKAIYGQGVRVGVYNGAVGEDVICLQQVTKNVGIGTTNPGAKLVVKGDQHVKALIVQNSDLSPVEMLAVEDVVHNGNNATMIKSINQSIYIIPHSTDSSGINQAIKYACPFGDISNIPVASGTITITTSAAHGLSNGDNIIISGSNSTPSIDGEYSISNASGSQFNITISQTITTSGNAANYRFANPRGSVFLPAANYTIDAQIVVPGGVTLSGAGQGATVLDAETLAADALVTKAARNGTNSWAPEVYITLNDFTVIGNLANPDYSAIHLQGVISAFLKNIHVTNAKTGIRVKGWVITLIGCWVESCYTGYDLSWPEAGATNSVSVTGCHFEGGTLAPPTANISSGSFSSPRVTINTSTNHRLQNGATATISGCTANYNGLYQDVKLPLATISSGSFSSPRVTITTAAPHDLITGCDARIAKCSNNSYNGHYTSVIVISATVFTALPDGFAPSGSASDGLTTSDTVFSAIPIGFIPSGTPSNGTVTGRMIGCYIDGYTNCLSGTTLERRITEYPPNETIGIFIKGAGNTLNGCYFEGWKTTYLFDGCISSNIVGGNLAKFENFNPIQFLNNADALANCNSIQNVFETEWRYTVGTGKWDTVISQGPIGKTGVVDLFTGGLEIRKDVPNDIGPVLTLNNKGGNGNTAIYMSGYEVGAHDPAAAIKSLDNRFSAHITFSTKKLDDPANALIERVRIQNDGNVGVGVSDPTAKLEVYDSSSNTMVNIASFLYTKDAGIQLFQQRGTAYRAALVVPGSENVSQWATDAAPGDFVIRSYNRLFLNNGAGTGLAVYLNNVGIGTASPGSLLEIRKDAFSAMGPILTLNNKAGAGNTAIYMNGYDVSLGAGPHDPAAAIKSLDNNWSAHITFSTKAPGASGNALTERVRIQNDGKIGIGTVSPSELLHIYNSSTTDPARIRIESGQDNSSNESRLDLVRAGSSSSSASIAFLNATTPIRWKTGLLAGSDDYQIFNSHLGEAAISANFNSGYVGIGMVSPGSTLQVNGNVAIGYESYQVAPNYGLAVAGSVGIGLASPASPAEMLEVNGAITVGNTAHATPSNGTIKFDGTNLKVYINGWHTIV